MVKRKRRKRKSRIKKGWYKGYWCDSSWELAYIMYNLDKGISIIRNVEGFPYTFYKKDHLYYPDFIVEGEFVEIKGIMNRKNKAKLKAFPHKIKVIQKVGIEKYLKYAKKKYGEKFYSQYEKKKKKGIKV